MCPSLNILQLFPLIEDMSILIILQLISLILFYFLCHSSPFYTILPTKKKIPSNEELELSKPSLEASHIG